MTGERHEIGYGLCGTLSPADVLNLMTEVRVRRPDSGAAHLEAVCLQGTRWNRETLRVSLLGGTAGLRDRVAAVAARWSAFANIQFQFDTQPDGDIRVSLVQSGINQSAVGTQALAIPAAEPTMRLGHLRESAPAFEFDYFVLHEFGHALGLLHEHQSPNQAIQWNRAQVYADCAALFGWDRPTVDREILRPFEAAAATATPFDRMSIMNYPVPEGWTLDGTMIPRASAPSTLDRQFIGVLYPR
jgi:serralysin